MLLLLKRYGPEGSLNVHFVVNVYLLHKLKPEEHTKHFLCPQFFTIPASPNVGYRVVADDKTRAGTEEKKLAYRLVRCWVGEIVSVSQRGLYDSSTRVPWRHNSGEEPPHHPNKLRVRWVVQICHLWQSASAWPWQRGSLLCGKKINKDVWGYCQIDF